MTYSAKEQEAINLCIGIEAIKSIANHELFKIIDVPMPPSQAEVLSPDQAEVRFHSHIHQELFLIRFLDFAHEKSDPYLTGERASCLDLLKSACQTKSFDSNNSVLALEKSVTALENWLEDKKKISLWLPTLNINENIEIEVARIQLLMISGNHSKHNLSRLTGVSQIIHGILISNEHSVSLKQIPLALDGFREHLTENHFAYYGTWMAELVNNIRWGIQTYLEPAFRDAYTRLDEPNGYRYEYPIEMQDDISKQWFWRLMNNIHGQPYHREFRGVSSLKGECSLEWIG